MNWKAWSAAVDEAFSQLGGFCCFQHILKSVTDMPKNIANRELVVYVLGLLGGEFKRIHTEDIAIKCHELFPDSFSWSRHPELPDKDIVRVALTDARKEKYGAIVEGRTGQNLGQTAKTQRGKTADGWILTAAGVEWLRESDLSSRLSSGFELADHRQRVRKQLRRVFQHKLWMDFENDRDGFRPSIGDLADLFRCRVDAASETWDGRFEDLERKAHAVDRPELFQFVERCKEAYQQQG
ncbi:hypothetical protein ACFLRO_01040 [Bacteroidota bacterium]